MFTSTVSSAPPQHFRSREKSATSRVGIDALIESKRCLLISVADRLSDYGPSGVLVLRSGEDSLVIESLALSCTVLGKQVEQAVLSALAQIAIQRDFSKVAFEYRPSGRNQAIAEFLDSVAAGDSETRRYVLAESRLRTAAASRGAWTMTLEPSLGNFHVQS